MKKVPESHWNYRIIEFVDPFNNEPYREIHSVHYENGIPWGYAEEGGTVFWETKEGNESAAKTLEWMRQALDKPVLVEKDFKGLVN